MRALDDSRPNIVVVTGASAGIGRATALAFARRGDWVAVLVRDPERVEATCAELRAAGATVLGIPVDVADVAQVDAAAERIERELGLISIWVNNASTAVFAPVLETTLEEYRRVAEAAYLGVVRGTLAALKRMHPRDQGCIMQTRSALAFRSIPLRSAYAPRRQRSAASPTRCAVN